jgi:hypothetical protein
MSHQRRPKKSKWTIDEDQQLLAAVHTYGTDSWGKISALVPTRSGKQCRERWIGQLAPSVSKEIWSSHEDTILKRQHALSGNRWTVVAAHLPGRSSLQVKNRWNWLMRHQGEIERLQRMPCRIEIVPDVIETRPAQRVFAPLALDDGLFGPAFQEFQAKMFLH